MTARNEKTVLFCLLCMLSLTVGCEPVGDDDDSASNVDDDDADNDDSATPDDDDSSTQGDDDSTAPGDDDSVSDDDSTSDDDTASDDDSSTSDDDDDSVPLDVDGDGWTDDVDCDDSNPDVNPGAVEVACDDIDNDCNGILDPNNVDNDGDGEDECNGDCNDNDSLTNSTAVELCNNQDNNCNGMGDEPYQTFWFDADGDYWGTLMSQLACNPVYPFVGTQPGDCDDNTAQRFPGNVEICDYIDNDCDYSLSGEEIDNDLDGLTECAGDCDDQDDQNFPGNVEICDRQDNDCDGITPSDETDDDIDGQTECEGDCDDLDDQNFSGNLEICDEQDNDCDWVVPNIEIDNDLDGQIECEGDCDDADPLNFLGNLEVCDRQDNDCDGIVPSVETDDDLDGQTECEGDCDDLDDQNFSGNLEVCDEQDNDCDGSLSDVEIDDDLDGQTECEGDCDDLDPDNFLGNSEQLDGWDNDCSGDADWFGLEDADSFLTGESYWSRTGSSVASAGDVNGDGYDDILVGAPGSPSSTGVAYLVLGSAIGIPSINLANADAIFTGVFPYDGAGCSVASAGDVNGDGYDDILVGASGKAYLILGSASGIPSMSLANADTIFTGEYLNDGAGGSVASAGDINGDGYDDILIGASANSYGAGAVYVVLGSPADIPSMNLSFADAKLTGEAPPNQAGASVASAGDINGDGYDDILVGAPWSIGAVYVVLGSATGIPSMSLSVADAKLIGEAPDNATGRSVSSAGDVNGDGYDDILVGAPGHDSPNANTGAVYVILGSATGISPMNLAYADAKLTGESESDGAGYSTRSAGDVNGDGYDDIIIGARNNQLTGATYVVLGSVSGIPSMSLSTASAKFVGESSSDQAGYSVAGAGDVNDDGYDDVLLGAPTRNFTGICYVIESAF